MNPNKLSFIIIFLFLVGCDCVTNKSGLVYDIKTNEPIQDAKVSLNSFTVSTDSLGRFAIIKISGFCPDWNIEVTKDNYKPFKLFIKKKGDNTIYKVQDRHSDKDWVKLNSTCFTAVNEDSIIIKLENN